MRPILEMVFAAVTYDNDFLELPPFILDPKQFFVIKLLLLHNQMEDPHFTGQGKIAMVGPLHILEKAIQPSRDYSEEWQRLLVALIVAACLSAGFFSSVLMTPISRKWRKKNGIG